MKNLKNNLIITIINLILLVYIINNYKNMDIFKEKIDSIYSREGLIEVKIIVTICFIILIYLIYKFFKYLSKITNINIINFFILLILIKILLINYKLESNHKISNKTKSLEDAIRDCNSYDIILFRSYHSYDFPELLFYRWLHSLTSDFYSGHVGIIYKENNKVYVIESTESFFDSHFDKKYKNGVVLNELEKYINEYDGNVYICHNNIHKYKTNEELYSVAYKYKDYVFNENNIGCVNLVKKIFSELDIISDKYQNSFFLPYSFTCRDKYKIKYEDYGKYCIKKYYKY